MDEKVFNALMKLCTELEEEAVRQLKDADIIVKGTYELKGDDLE